MLGISSKLFPKAIDYYLKIVNPFMLLAPVLNEMENLILIIILLYLMWITR